MRRVNDGGRREWLARRSVDRGRPRAGALVVARDERGQGRGEAGRAAGHDRAPERRAGRRARAHRRRPLGDRAQQGRSPLQGRGVDGQPRVPPPHAGLPRDRAGGRQADLRRRPRLAGRAARALRRRERARRRRALEPAGHEPGRAQGHARHRRAQPDPRRAQLRARHAQAAAHPRDGRHVGVRGGGEPGGHARRGRAAHGRVRAHPVRGADVEGARAAAARHAADDQQVLHHRPGAGPQHDRVRAQAGPARVRDLLAQPRRAPRRLGLRHLRAGDARGARRRRDDHGRGRLARARPVRGRDRGGLRGRAPRGDRASRTASPASASA